MTLFFYGPNTFLLRRQVQQMAEAYRTKAGNDFGLERLDGTQIKPRELMAALMATPFLANSRLVIIEGLAGNKSTADKLAGFLEKVPESTVAIFVEREVDQRTVAFKTLSKADKVVKFEALSGPKLTAWAKQEVEKLSGTIEREALRELTDLTGDDQWRLHHEIIKLVNYNAEITRDAVRRLVAPSIDQSIFDLVEAMTAGRADEALRGYHQLLRQKESEIYVLTMIQWQLRNLLLAKTSPGLSQAELAKAVGMSPYVAGKMLGIQRKFAEPTLRQAYRAAADCEYDIKSGRTRAEAAVEQLIYQVAAVSKTK